MLKYPAFVLLVAVLLWSYPAFTQTVYPGDSEIEAILGVRVDARGIVFQVRTNGCTQKGDFEVLIFESKPLQLLLVRNRQDMCEAVVPYGRRIRFSYQELGLGDGDRIRVLNPLSTFRVAQAQ